VVFDTPPGQIILFHPTLRRSNGGTGVGDGVIVGVTEGVTDGITEGVTDGVTRGVTVGVNDDPGETSWIARIKDCGVSRMSFIGESLVKSFDCNGSKENVMFPPTGTLLTLR